MLIIFKAQKLFSKLIFPQVTANDKTPLSNAFSVILLVAGTHNHLYFLFNLSWLEHIIAGSLASVILLRPAPSRVLEKNHNLNNPFDRTNHHGVQRTVNKASIQPARTEPISS